MEYGDNISRQAAIEKILGQPPEAHYPSWYARQIEDLPPAQPTFDARDTQYNLPIGTDLISRKQAIEVVQNRHMMLSKEKVLLINDLEKLPSVQPKRGKLREMNHDLGYECSECGWESDAPYDFFPNCGAKMEGVDNES